MRKTRRFAGGVLAFTIVIVAPGQQARRVDDAALRNAGKSGEDWLSYGVTPQETRYSSLTQINAGYLPDPYLLHQAGARGELHCWTAR
jgi:glucose dehydrogenase